MTSSLHFCASTSLRLKGCIMINIHLFGNGCSELNNNVAKCEQTILQKNNQYELTSNQKHKLTIVF